MCYYLKMKNKIFRVTVLISSLVPAALSLGMAAASIFEGSLFMFLMFSGALVIYGEYVYNTFKLFNNKD